jgi:hypothetical protein
MGKRNRPPFPVEPGGAPLQVNTRIRTVIGTSTVAFTVPELDSREFLTVEVGPPNFVPRLCIVMRRRGRANGKILRTRYLEMTDG